MGGLILILFLLSAVAGCSGEDKGPAQVTQEKLGHHAGESAQAQDAAGLQEQQAKESKAGTPKILFDQKEFDFGEMEAGEKLEHIFAFRNTGNGTLRIEKVRSG
jgi:hypothetical protein